jgi:hypothetical protein
MTELALKQLIRPTLQSAGRPFEHKNIPKFVLPA